MSSKETLQGYQQQLETVADQVVDQIEDALVSRIADRLTDFLTGGGLQARVMAKLSPVHQQFRSSLALKDTSGQGFGKQLKSADLAGGNRDI